MDLQAKRAERAEKLKAAKAFQTAAKKEKRDLTPDELKSVEQLLDEADAIKAEIAAAQERLDIEVRLESEVVSLSQPQVRRVPAQAALETHASERIETRERWREDPALGFRSARGFFAAVLNADSGRHHANSPEQNAALRSIFAHSEPHKMFRAAVGSDEQGGYADPYGGYLIPESFIASLLQVDPEADPTVGKTQSIPMASPTVKIPARVDKNHANSVSGGLRVYRRAEADTSASSRQEYEQVVMQANSLLGLTYATEEILTDSAISLAALIEAGFKQEFAARLLNEKLNGTGVGEFEGILNTPGLVSISKETGQAATTINTQNILKMRARNWGYGNSIWLANHDTFPQLMQLTLAVGTGGSAVAMTNIRDDGINTLLGRPIFYTEFCKTLGTVGDLILGNWSQFLEGTYQPMQGAESIHVRFINHERTFKFWMRNDGRSWWRTALTPKQGSNTLSPFVALATRA